MKSAAVPWSVKGIDADAREMAKEAARRSGMTLGEWLRSAINEQADGPELPRPPRAYQPADSFERATSKLEDIAVQLAKLAQPQQGYSVYAPAERREEGENVSRILGRIEANERQSVEAFTAVNDRLATMGRQFAQAAKAATTFKPEEHPSFQALEKAVRNIVEHLESSEKRTRDNFKTMGDRLSDMTSRAAAAPSESLIRQLPAFSGLEQRLNELSRRVDVTERQAEPSVPDLLRKELTDLAGRIDVVRETAESLATRAQTQAVLTSQQELRTIENRMQGVLREAQSAFSKGSASDGELQRIRADVEALNKRIDSTRQGTASDRDVHALRVAVEQLSTRVAQGPDLRPLQDMDKRIVELAQRINATPQPDLSQFSELDSRITELDQRLAQALLAPQNTDANEALTRQIAAVAERMDKAETQLSHLDTIERAINQLYDGLEQSRNMSQQLAEDAATRTVQQFAAQMPQAQASADVQALEQGLQAVKEAAESSDQRNQETLLALHETLEHIVGKLSELETVTIGHRIAAAAVAAPVHHVPPVHTPTAHVPEPAAYEPEPVVAETVAAAAVPQRFEPAPAPTEFAPDTIPSEGFQALAPEIEEAPASAAEEAPVEPRLPMDEPVLAPVASAKSPADDFIAAARAAQAAASQPGKSLLGGARARRGKVKTEATAAKSSSGSLLAKLAAKLKRAEKPEARTAAEEIRARSMSALEATAPGTDKSRRKLLYIGLLMLTAAAAISASKFGGSVKQVVPAKVSELLAPVLGPDVAVETVEDAAPAVAVAEAPVPAAAKSAPPVADEILTGSVAPTAEPIATEMVAQPLDEAALPPAQIGPQRLREAAAGGDAMAQFVVASRYLDGERVERDFAKAATWYGKAAATGLAPAQYRIATLYERGKGVDKDLKMALDWYEKAAALGNVRSMHNSAVIYAGSEAGKPDYAKAYKWFALAANHGLKDSQFNLAILLERGLGVKADPAEAMFWYLAAARQNDEDGQKRADAIAALLSPAQAEKVKIKIKAWQPEQAPEAANLVEVNDSAWQDKAG